MKLRPRAALTWTPDGAPFADDFGDIYYSKHGGLDETRAVFLDALDLPSAWRGKACSVIGELGFGAGLNALATWALWRGHRAPGAILHFISVEGFPMAREDAARALAAFPELAALAQKLIARWPCRASGAHRLWFAEDGFCLTIVHEDIADALAMIDGPIDGWILDGFAPARNPDMWSEDILRAIAGISAPGARAATYSVAGQVRRDLAVAGFDVQRAPGFGAKKERLAATLTGRTGTAQKPLPQSALIAGGGIAGACAAAALKKRGLHVTIVDAGGLASGASGNPAGIVSPRLDIGDDPAGQFLRAAYLYAVDHYAAEAPEAFEACGIVRGEADAIKAAKLAVDPNLPEEWLRPTDPAAHGITSPAAFELPQAGLLDPARAIAALTEGCAILTGRAIASLRSEATQWQARDSNGEVIGQADILILASGAGAAQLIPPDWLPLEGRRGAVSIAQQIAPGNDRAISAGAYVFRWRQDLIFGATFDPAPLDQPIAPIGASDHARNAQTLHDISPQRACSIEPMENWRGRAAMRVTTPDQLPVAGAMPDLLALQPDLEKLRNGAISEKAIQAPAITGLYVLCGLGARGLTTAPLLGEYIACLALGEPSPLPPDLRRAVAPERFLLRKARHNKL